jgi:hypothetical protein
LGRSRVFGAGLLTAVLYEGARLIFFARSSVRGSGGGGGLSPGKAFSSTVSVVFWSEEPLLDEAVAVFVCGGAALAEGFALP